MAAQVWWCKVGKFRLIDAPEGLWEYRALVPKSMYAQFEIGKVGGAYENGIVKMRLVGSENLTVEQRTDWMNLGCRPEEAGVCEAEIIDYSDVYFENWEPIPTPTPTAT